MYRYCLYPPKRDRDIVSAISRVSKWITDYHKRSKQKRATPKHLKRAIGRVDGCYLGYIPDVTPEEAAKYTDMYLNRKPDEN